MKLFIDNLADRIDLDALIDTCVKAGGHEQYGPKPIEEGKHYHEEYIHQVNLMEKAGYLGNGQCRFKHYYPDQQFPKSISLQVAEAAGVEHLGSFISSVDPGYCAPWHTDIFNNYYREMEDEGVDMRRFVMFISKPQPAVGFVIEDECFYMEKQGNLYEFPHIKNWHAGFNAGLETKFIFTLTGRK